jgi:hypothetical protein
MNVGAANTYLFDLHKYVAATLNPRLWLFAQFNLLNTCQYNRFHSPCSALCKYLDSAELRSSATIAILLAGCRRYPGAGLTH